MHSYTRPRKQVGYYEEELLSEQIDEDEIINSYGDDADYNISSDEEIVSSRSRVSNGRTRRKKKDQKSAATSSQQWKARKLKSCSSYEMSYGCPSDTEHIICSKDDRPSYPWIKDLIDLNKINGNDIGMLVSLFTPVTISTTVILLY